MWKDAQSYVRVPNPLAFFPYLLSFFLLSVPPELGLTDKSQVLQEVLSKICLWSYQDGISISDQRKSQERE